MSYEDIEEARATRAAKDVIKGKGKRGRKRKSIVQELDEPEPDELEVEPEVAHAAEEVIAGKRKRRRNRKSVMQEEDVPGPGPEPEQEVARTIEATRSWKAPVARMY
jgi:hypothetical protein